MSVFNPFPKSKQLPPKKGAQHPKSGTTKIKTKKPRLALMSKKAKIELKITQAIKKERMRLLKEKFGIVPCELCKIATVPHSLLLKAEYHHNDHDRRNNTLENCRILHRTCNQRVEDENIKNVKSLL